MVRAIFFRRRGSRLYQACGWGCALIYLALASGASIGLPVPTGPAAGERYPCEHGRCGCRTADQCWHHCCCHSVAQRLAWAEANGVTPPRWVEEAAPPASTSRSAATCCAPSTPLEDEPAVGNHFVHESAGELAATASCCAAAPQDDAAPSRCAGLRCSKASPRGIVLLEALKCRGAGDNWLGLAPALLPPIADWQHADAPEPAVALPVVRRLSVSMAPPTPPPRSRLALLV
jgi:hypothetical protein